MQTFVFPTSRFVLDEELTVKELGGRLLMLERVSHEMAHLVKFTSEFIKRVEEKG